MLDAVLTGSSTSNSFAVGIGGTGGSGGSAGAVSVTNSSTGIIVTGATVTNGVAQANGNGNADGILAMSIGGGGGTGSNTVSAVLGGGSGGASSSAAISVGGAGGTGGTGGEVTVLNNGGIETYGAVSNGIAAVSVGGGGGNGGMAISGDVYLSSQSICPTPNVTLAVGGSGGSGNSGGTVTVTNNGYIQAAGYGSDGILAQSVGGGGGNGKLAVSLSNNSVLPSMASLTSIGLGGFGGSGGNGGNVTVNNTGDIVTMGANSFGILAQSVSGGGGTAAFTISSPAWMAADYALSSTLGGGSTGATGKVQINNTGNIEVTGDNSHAMLAQSVSGGGDLYLYLDFSGQPTGLGPQVQDASVSNAIALGSVNVTQMNGADLTSTTDGNFATNGQSSFALLQQSVGGGGGNIDSTTVLDTQGSTDLEATLGATQTDNSSGGNIASNRNGSIVTTGDDSMGDIEQSIGGGGGTLVAEVDRVASGTGSPAGAATASITLGGNHATASNGGNLNLTAVGNVSTSGTSSAGILVQSIGGGGGAASLSGFDSAQAILGGSNGSSGNGGAINFTNTGSIATTGTAAHGVVLQSIGGGGGALFTGLSPNQVSVTTSSANSGNGGNIDFTQNGDVSVSGNNAIGIVAQSLGGGGGLVDNIFMNTAGGAGASGNVNLMVNGSVQASGANGIGIFAQSLGGINPGTISINLAAGNSIDFGANGVGIQISGGSWSQVTNNGSISGADGLQRLDDRVERQHAGGQLRLHHRSAQSGHGRQ